MRCGYRLFSVQNGKSATKYKSLLFIYHILLIEMINPNYITHLDNVVRIHHCLVRVSLKDL
nr:MAG TPA: hypothetical protein [Caudoviricetes sp.]